MKPDWKDSPNWAKYLAMDSNGVWNWFSHKPIWYANESYEYSWTFEPEHYCDDGYNSEPCNKVLLDPQKTLEARP